MCRGLCKASQPGSCNQSLSSIARFHALPLTSPIFWSRWAHTQNFKPPVLTSSYPLLYTKWTFALIHILSIQILSKLSEKQYWTGSLTTSKISTSMFSIIGKTCRNRTSFQQTVTTQSLHNQISTSTTTSLKHLKSLFPPQIIIFCCFILNSTPNNFHWLTNYSHYITNSRLIRLHAFYIHASHPTPKIYNATALLTRPY